MENTGKHPASELSPECEALIHPRVVYQARLRQWASFIRKVDIRNLKMDSWYGDTNIFRTWISSDRIHSCGTTACAAGWLPVIFPDHWYITDSGSPVCYDIPVTGSLGLFNRGTTYSVATFFGLSVDDVGQIIFASMDDPAHAYDECDEYFDCNCIAPLGPEEVAELIDEAVDLVLCEDSMRGLISYMDHLHRSTSLDDGELPF